MGFENKYEGMNHRPNTVGESTIYMGKAKNSAQIFEMSLTVLLNVTLPFRCQKSLPK